MECCRYCKYITLKHQRAYCIIQGDLKDHFGHVAKNCEVTSFERPGFRCSEFDWLLEVVDTFSGSPLERGKGSREKQIRRLLNLPLTKQLVYYPDRRQNKTVNVRTAVVMEKYSLTSLWYVLGLVLENGENVKINSMYFAEMQDLNFVKNMAEQDKEV